MVFDVPAESGGALSVLNDYYFEAKKSHNTTWFFVLSNPKLKETSNINVLRFPWIKNSWLHRIFFDKFIAPRLVKKYKVDKVVSLQNILVPNVKCEQILYVHQPLPFINYKYSLKENKLFWIYQNIIGWKIIHSIRKANKIIVQTEWMKVACSKKAQVCERKFDVIPPSINIKINNMFKPTKESLSTFFYPASGLAYKNHQIIVDACSQLVNMTNKKFKVIFTLNGNENELISDLYRRIQDERLPILFEGTKQRNDVFELYTKSVLIFPSFIETFGYPLLEAKLHKGIILAAETEFAKEIVNGYDKAWFFDAFDSNELCQLMHQCLNYHA